MRVLTVIFTSLFVLSLTGCGSSSSSAINDKNTTKIEDSIKQNESEVSQPGPFTTAGEFGRININDEEYDDLNNTQGSKVVEGAIFVDIRNKWEREDPGQPYEVISDIIIYDIRNEQRVGDHLNPNFVQEMTDLVDGDKNKKIVLICHTGSRSANAAKLLSENGFTNIYDIEGGFNAWEGKFKTASYSNVYQ